MKGLSLARRHLHLAIIYGFREVAEMLIRLVPHPNFVSLKNSYLQVSRAFVYFELMVGYPR